jgi:uncharacterized protein
MMLDRRGILSFLAITFGLTYAVEIAVLATGVRFTAMPPIIAQYVVAAMMWAPALGVLVTIRWVTHERFAITRMRIGSWRPYLVSALFVPVVFAVIYGLTWLLGLAEPDWQLAWLKGLMTEYGADMSQMPPVAAFWPILLVASIIVGPTINGLFALGEEIGWRGYLLPKLMPLGRWPAYLISGVIWGLWHAPIVWAGFNYPGHPIAGIVAMCAMTTAIGIYLNVLAQHHQSTILAAWIHGAFNGQGYGVWRILFPGVNPLLGGMTGLVGISVWFVIGWWMMRRIPAARSAAVGTV